MKQLILIAAFLASSSVTQDKPALSIFGMTIMQPISLPECAADVKAVDKYRKAKAKYPGMPFLHYPYDVNRVGPCYKRDDKFAGNTTPPVDENLTIDFPMSALPEGAKWDSVYAVIIEGKVQSIGFMTYGMDSQGLVMDQLRGKFGEPMTNKIVSKQNGYGAKFESIEASWNFGSGVMLVFEGTGLRTDYGTVTLQTAAARQKYLESMKKLTSGTPM